LVRCNATAVKLLEADEITMARGRCCRAGEELDRKTRSCVAVSCAAEPCKDGEKCRPSRRPCDQTPCKNYVCEAGKSTPPPSKVTKESTTVAPSCESRCPAIFEPYCVGSTQYGSKCQIYCDKAAVIELRTGAARLLKGKCGASSTTKPRSSTKATRTAPSANAPGETTDSAVEATVTTTEDPQVAELKRQLEQAKKELKEAKEAKEADEAEKLKLKERDAEEKVKAEVEKAEQVRAMQADLELTKKQREEYKEAARAAVADKEALQDLLTKTEIAAQLSVELSAFRKQLAEQQASFDNAGSGSGQPEHDAVDAAAQIGGLLNEIARLTEELTAAEESKQLVLDSVLAGKSEEERESISSAVDQTAATSKAETEISVELSSIFEDSLLSTIQVCDVAADEFDLDKCITQGKELQVALGTEKGVDELVGEVDREIESQGKSMAAATEKLTGLQRQAATQALQSTKQRRSGMMFVLPGADLDLMSPAELAAAQDGIKDGCVAAAAGQLRKEQIHSVELSKAARRRSASAVVTVYFVDGVSAAAAAAIASSINNAIAAGTFQVTFTQVGVTLTVQPSNVDTVAPQVGESAGPESDDTAESDKGGNTGIIVVAVLVPLALISVAALAYVHFNRGPSQSADAAGGGQMFTNPTYEAAPEAPSNGLKRRDSVC
jgi:hypothetical protein